jgi:3-hydroxybutyrate dehydrogenase
VTKIFSLDGKVALMTGASRGLGRAMALALAGCGAHVVVNGRNAAGIEKTRDSIVAAGGKATAMAFDTTDIAKADAAIDRIEKDLGHLDILVNNAGYGNAKTATEATNAEWNEIIEVDLNACFRLAKRASVGMIRRGWGRIINISSINGKRGDPGKAAYCAAKHGVIGLTRTVALEAGADGITVNAICPGLVDTPLIRGQLVDLGKIHGLAPEEVLEKFFLPKMVTGRAVETSEIAGLVRYLASDAAASITGQAINIDGGTVMH